MCLSRLLDTLSPNRKEAAMNELQSDQSIFNGLVPGTPTAVPAPAPKAATGGRSIHPLLVSLVIFMAVKLCPGMVSTAWQTMAALPSEMERIALVMDQVMAAGKARDARAIYALFPTETQSTVPLSDVESLIRGSNYAAFAEYRELSITAINLTWAGTTTAEVSGSIAYDDGYTGDFTAELVKEDGGWRLQGFNITVPPNKIGTTR
jgi:hypothetical protein